MSATITRPTESEYAPAYAGYVSKVPDGNVIDLLRAQLAETLSLLRAVPEARGAHRYAEDKWSIKQVVGHLADTERIMTYRALRIARSDRTPLASFDENEYVRHASFDSRSLASLISEFEQVRLASIAFFDSLTEEEAARAGVASNRDVTARALAYIVAGHERHHVGLLRERYL